MMNLTDLETLKRKVTVTGHADWITSLSVNSHVKAVVTSSLDQHIKVWDINSGKCVKSMAMSAPIWGVAFAPSGQHIVSACQDGTITLTALQL